MSLHREDVRVIFGLPGVQLYHLLDGLYEEPDIRFITTRQEQATTYMVDGYGRAGDGVGTAYAARIVKIFNLPINADLLVQIESRYQSKGTR